MGIHIALNAKFESKSGHTLAIILLLKSLWLQSVRSSDPMQRMPRLMVTVHRESVFEDSLSLLKDLSSVDLKSSLKISFIDEHGDREAGIDGGGLFKDFMECLLRVCHSDAETTLHVP